MASKIDELERRGYKGYNEQGEQMVDPTPVRLPVGFKHVDNFAERVRQIVRGERLKAEAEAMGAESFEEADDFDVPDDPIDPSTPYEADFDAPSPAELKREQERRFAEEDREDQYIAAREERRANIRGVGKGTRSKGVDKKDDREKE